MALAVVPALSLLLLVTRPVWDVDVFWQLRLGEMILAHGGPILREPFAARHLGEPLPTVAWAGQALYAALREAGGWPLLRTFDALFWLGGFWAAGWAARRRGASALGLALGLAMGLIAALPQASVRPQSLAALGFGLLVALVFSRLRPAPKLAWGAILLVVWQNLHPSVAIAVVWLGALAAWGWLAFLRRRLAPPWVATGLALLAGLALFATPEGIGILSVSAANAAMSRAMGVSEWLPLWAPINRQVALPILAVAGVTAWLLRRSGRFALDELLPALALLVLTMASYRFVLFWAIALVPVVARAAVAQQPEARLPGWLRGAPLVLAALAGILLPVRFSPQLPLAEIAVLRASGAAGTIYAHFPWGGPLIDAGYPQWRLAYDGRYYRYTPEEWDAYGKASRGELSLAQVEAAWHPAAFLLDPQWNAPLIAALRADRAHWRELPGHGPLPGRAVAFVPAVPGAPRP
ncbi:hypothetical protein ACFOD9_10725 [Novosphingobium bradum]|uniref:Glycosyltransferase RgtA/B/C/D-like domain-containing protein n=1 Tax=Novosphingobium bradum TaxID=1737444 RepID=A0ABV7IS01_9SPHN